MASLAATVWKAAKYAKYTAYASNLAQQQMERLRGDPSYFTSTMNGPATGRAYASDFDVDDGQPVHFQGELDLHTATGASGSLCQHRFSSDLDPGKQAPRSGSGNDFARALGNFFPVGDLIAKTTGLNAFLHGLWIGGRHRPHRAN